MLREEQHLKVAWTVSVVLAATMLASCSHVACITAVVYLTSLQARGVLLHTYLGSRD